MNSSFKMKWMSLFTTLVSFEIRTLVFLAAESKSKCFKKNYGACHRLTVVTMTRGCQDKNNTELS